MRFAFGKNWRAFLRKLSESHIQEAESSIKEMLQVKNLEGKCFLDIGCGSGVFSLAAVRLGARVVSFDYDIDSVKCTQTLKNRYFNNLESWKIEQGSVLDAEYLARLGHFDIVYSWGVLHHTGDMWTAITNAAKLLKPGGLFFIAIYNDQGLRSKFWTQIKRLYCMSIFSRLIILSVFIPYFAILPMIKYVIIGKNPFSYFKEYKQRRGMHPLYNWIDWLGGYPFETASMTELIEHGKKMGLELINSKCTRGLGCNQLVFRSDRSPLPLQGKCTARK